MTARIKFYLSLMTALILMVSASAASAQIALRFSPPDTTIEPSDTTRISVMLDDAVYFRTIELTVTYDSTLIRTVEEDPRDLTAARKYMSVYLMGARDATIKFADIYGRSRDAQARADYMALLDDLEQNFAARTQKMLLDDRSDLNIEIEVLRDRLKREGIRAE